jgi:hypothetical protein
MKKLEDLVVSDDFAEGYSVGLAFGSGQDVSDCTEKMKNEEFKRGYESGFFIGRKMKDRPQHQPQKRGRPVGSRNKEAESPCLHEALFIEAMAKMLDKYAFLMHCYNCGERWGLMAAALNDGDDAVAED